MWGITFALYFVCVCLYLYRGRERETFHEKIIYFGFSLYILFFGLTRLFAVLLDLSFDGFYIDLVFYGDMSIINFETGLFTRLINISASLSVIMLTLTFELYLRKTRYFLSVISIIFALITIIAPLDISNLAALLSSFILNTISFCSLIYIFTKWTQIEYKSFSALLFCGFINIGIGAFFQNPELKQANFMPVEFSPILVILSAIFFMTPLLIKVKYLRYTITFWTSIGIYCVGLVSILMIIILLQGVAITYIFIGLFNLILFGLFFYNTLKVLKSEKEQIEKSEIPDVLGMFDRPKRITELEVSISKEKKICLVCKGKVFGITFLCRDCEAFYCQKCYIALTQLENVCWACNNVLDETKPVKLSKEKEDLVTKQEPKKLL
ncbi:MAG: hypothetical protein ACFE9Z_12470 [Promethearchaeota archaeon]